MNDIKNNMRGYINTVQDLKRNVCVHLCIHQ